MIKTAKIYCLTDPNTQDVMYVGQTVSEIKTRLSGHITDAFMLKDSGGFVYDTAKEQWIRSLVNAGKRPVISLVAEVKDSDKRFWEAFFIESFRESYSLLNKSIPCKTPVTTLLRHEQALRKKGVLKAKKNRNYYR